MKRVFSFDVFDTCLTRKAAAPSDVFYMIGEKLASVFKIEPTRPWLEDFVAARINSESKARERSSREDVTLTEIWTLLAESMGWAPDEDLQQSELEAENEALIPVPSVRKEIQRARATGARILFVSDMYLPAEFIEDQLRKHGFIEKGDGLYVSSEVGKLKSTGNLFRYLLEKENLTPSELFHLGDNSFGDYLVPQRLGIKAKLTTKACLSSTEKALVATEPTARGLAGSMRAFRVQNESAGNVTELVSQFIGPFILGLATWVLRRAQHEGVERLYFVSRDAQLLGKAARRLAPFFGKIECRYLYVSRQALLLPSIERISPQGMPWMKRSFERSTLASLLAKLELKVEDVASAFGASADEAEAGRQLIDTKERWSAFWETLQDEGITEKIRRTVALRRDDAMRYFEGEGLFEEVPWAMVDLGWFLTCQQSLQTILQKRAPKMRMRGFYFGLNMERGAPGNRGDAEALFYEPPFDSPAAAAAKDLFKRATILEHLIGCADHPSVHHYSVIDGHPRPVFKNQMDEKLADDARQIHAISLSYIADNLETIAEFKDEAACQDILHALVLNFFERPSQKAALAVRNLQTSSDQNGFHAAPLAHSISLGSALSEWLPQSWIGWATRRNQPLWREGSFALSPPIVQKILLLAPRLKRWRRALRGSLSIQTL